jgi:DNA gyrase subunit A
MLMSTGGTVIRVPAEGIKRSGRSTQGVIVMRLREGEHVSTLARVVETEDPEVLGVEDGAEPPEATAAADEVAEPAPPGENGAG